MGLEHQALLAEHVFAGFQHVMRDAIVREERRDHEDRLHILHGQQVMIVLEGLRAAADGGEAVLEVVVLNIANSHALSGADVLQVLHQVRAAASRADHAVLNAVVSGLHFLDGGSANRGGGRGDSPGGYYEIPAGEIVFRRRVQAWNLAIGSLASTIVSR